MPITYSHVFTSVIWIVHIQVIDHMSLLYLWLCCFSYATKTTRLHIHLSYSLIFLLPTGIRPQGLLCPGVMCLLPQHIQETSQNYVCEFTSKPHDVQDCVCLYTPCMSNVGVVLLLTQASQPSSQGLISCELRCGNPGIPQLESQFASTFIR